MSETIESKLDLVIDLLTLLTEREPIQNDTWMRPSELAKLLGVTEKTLANLRSARKLYPFYKPEGSRTPLYNRSEIYEIIERSQHTVRS